MSDMNLDSEKQKEVLLTGRMAYTPDYFHKAAASYADWRGAWWREALQNSLDAGATEIALTSKTDAESETCTLQAIDNGSGMSQETLIERFLAFGGSQKSADAVGGFGKAKELLILPWVRWSMRSRDLHAHGVAMDWTLERSAETGKTTLEIEMAGPATRQTHLWAARAVLARSHLPGVQITLCEGQDAPETVEGVAVGTFVREFSFGKLYLCDAKHMESYLLVRVKGLFMHYQYLHTSLPDGKVLVLEVSTPSTETFTDNRDALLPDYKKELDKFVQEYSADRHSALMDQTKLEKHVYRGSGTFRARQLHERAERISDRIAESQDAKAPLDDNQIDNLLSMLADMVQNVENEAGGSQTTNFRKFQKFNVATARAALETVDVDAGSLAMEKLLKQLVWEPDFLCISKIPGYRIPAEMLPETMSPRVTKLALVWTELCRYVLALLKCDQEFGTGFVFSEEGYGGASAAHLRLEDGSNWLVINPFKDGKTMIAPTSDDDLSQMFASAVHECTHLANGLSRHDQDFAEALTNNFALCAKGWRKIKQIERGAKMTNKVQMATLKEG